MQIKMFAQKQHMKDIPSMVSKYREQHCMQSLAVK